MFIKKNIESLISYIIELKKIKNKEDLNYQVISHFVKIDFIVKSAILTCFILLNFFSFIIYQKFIYSISNLEKKKVIDKTSFLFHFLVVKTLEVLHALICIHVFNDEKIEVKKTIGDKCPRCWKILETNCVRCEEAESTKNK